MAWNDQGATVQNWKYDLDRNISECQSALNQFLVNIDTINKASDAITINGNNIDIINKIKKLVYKVNAINDLLTSFESKIIVEMCYKAEWMHPFTPSRGFFDYENYIANRSKIEGVNIDLKSPESSDFDGAKGELYTMRHHYALQIDTSKTRRYYFYYCGDEWHIGLR